MAVGPERAEIAAARIELRKLDAEISRTEIRLRSLPGQVRGGGGRGGGGGRPGVRRRSTVIYPVKSMAGATDRAGAKSRRVLRMSQERVAIGAAKVGANGLQISRGGISTMLGRAAGPVVGMHVIGGSINQAFEFADKQATLEARYGLEKNAGRRLGNAVTGAGVGALRTLSDLTGISTFASALARIGNEFTGDGKAGHEKMIEQLNHDLEEALLSQDFKRARAAEKRKLKQQARAQIYQQRLGAAYFIDRWTPNDFMAFDDLALQQIREETRERNIDVINETHRSEQRREFDEIDNGDG